MTFTGAIGSLCMFPLRAIISRASRSASSKRAHARRRHHQRWRGMGARLRTFRLAFLHHAPCHNLSISSMARWAYQLQLQSGVRRLLGSTLDRSPTSRCSRQADFSVPKLGRSDYCWWPRSRSSSRHASYARARAESLVSKCKVGFMERPERIVLFMIGRRHQPDGRRLWVILTLSVLTVANRIYYTYRRHGLPMPSRTGGGRHVSTRVFLDRRATTIPYEPG